MSIPITFKKGYWIARDKIVSIQIGSCSPTELALFVTTVDGKEHTFEEGESRGYWGSEEYFREYREKEMSNVKQSRS